MDITKLEEFMKYVVEDLYKLDLLTYQLKMSMFTLFCWNLALSILLIYTWRGIVTGKQIGRAHV